MHKDLNALGNDIAKLVVPVVSRDTTRGLARKRPFASGSSSGHCLKDLGVAKTCGKIHTIGNMFVQQLRARGSEGRGATGSHRSSLTVSGCVGGRSW